MSTSYKPLSYWAQNETAERENWYASPGGTSLYELNTNVSIPSGPSWGPKARLFSQQKLSSKQYVVMGIGIIVLLCFLLVIFHQLKK